MTNSCKARLIKLGSKEKYQRLLKKELGTFGIASGHVMLKPGENIGGHTTGGREEIIIVLKGRGEARVDKDIILEIDDSLILYIPPETNHDIKNTGSEILRYIFITAAAREL